MNTKALFTIAIGLAIARVSVEASRGEFDFETARPSKKAPIAVRIVRNPFLAAAEPEKPLPVLHDKDDPATKVPAILTMHLRSVLRQPRELILVDTAVFQPGDELKLGREPLLTKYRVVLKRIEADRLVLNVASTDPQQPGQVEASVALVGKMRRN
ncbi:MAG TPA: hypothetical protein VFT72_19380 [Opitutaceae bacterium]|nr:hypothetical protein [Opitutaceae bacterium]